MDHKDTLRQEFINHLSVASDAYGKTVRVPPRSSFRTVPTTGSWVENNSGNNSYAYDVMLDDSMGSLVSELETIIETGKATTFTVNGGDIIEWPIEADITVTSGFRNPERNERVGGASGSRHMLGRAVDIGIHGVSGKDKEIAYYILWEILKGSQPATSDFMQLEVGATKWVKKLTGSNQTTHADWNDDDQSSPIGVDDGFRDVDHLHLQDNPS